jgi:hypothetical protein
MRARLALRVSLVLLAAAGSACASSAPARDGGRARRPDPDVITQAQLRDGRFINVYEAVAALHSNWLQTRGPDSFQTPSQVWVYMDNVRLGGVETLRQIAPPSIAYVRRYDGRAATSRWGLDHGQGVIFLSTRPDDVR